MEMLNFNMVIGIFVFNVPENRYIHLPNVPSGICVGDYFSVLRRNLAVLLEVGVPSL
jgi:hypothetical protein